MAGKASNIVESAQQRRKETETKVRQAMVDIEADMAANDGTYQENAGKVTLTELFRRAGVGRTTLSGDHHRAFMAEIKAWASAHATKRRPTQKMRAAEKAEEVEGLKQAIERLAADVQTWAARCDEAERLVAERDARIASLERRIRDHNQGSSVRI
jgi:beta-phosphoglucomutase-like phosphatase (HAD superfamily)